MTTERKCFLISPIGDAGSETRKRSDDLKKYIIEPVLKDLGIKLERADTLTNPGDITTKVIVKINEADLIIADLTDRNPNVFYELAISHALRKPVIHMIKKGQSVPFDIQQYNYISYDNNDLDMLEPSKEELKKQIESIQANPDNIINPFTEALNFIKINKSGDPKDKIIAELRGRIEIIDVRLRRLESILSRPSLSTSSSGERARERIIEIEDRIALIRYKISELENKLRLSKEEIMEIQELKKELESLKELRSAMVHGIDRD